MSKINYFPTLPLELIQRILCNAGWDETDHVRTERVCRLFYQIISPH